MLKRMANARPPGSRSHADTRFRVLTHLNKAPATAGELAKALGLALSTIVVCIKDLRNQGFVHNTGFRRYAIHVLTRELLELPLAFRPIAALLAALSEESANKGVSVANSMRHKR